jgi:hypothetical protein
MITMDNEEIFDAIIAKLNEAQAILTKELPMPDMDVAEWNATPIGRAVSRIGDVLELMQELELE